MPPPYNPLHNFTIQIGDIGLSMDDIISVQPMTAPTSSAFFLNFNYDKEVIPKEIRIDFVIGSEDKPINRINRFRDY